MKIDRKKETGQRLARSAVKRDPEQTSNKLVGKRLRQAREDRHLSQTEFAAQVGLTRNQLANYESGRTPLPTGVALKICRHFVIGEQWLATGDSWPWGIVDLLSEPEAAECDQNEPFSANFDSHFFVKYFMLNNAKETALTFRERYDRLLNTAGGDKHRLWSILERLLRRPSPASDGVIPKSEEPDDLGKFYEKLIRICLDYEIKWSGGVEREEKEIEDRRAAKVIFDKQQEKALAWMDKHRNEVGSKKWLDKMLEIFTPTDSAQAGKKVS